MEIARHVIFVILPISIASMLLTFLAIPAILAILAISDHDDTAGLPDSLVNRRLNVNMELTRVTTRRVQSFGADRLAGLQAIASDLGVISVRHIWEAHLLATKKKKKKKKIFIHESASIISLPACFTNNATSRNLRWKKTPSQAERFLQCFLANSQDSNS